MEQGFCVLACDICAEMTEQGLGVAAREIHALIKKAAREICAEIKEQDIGVAVREICAQMMEQSFCVSARESHAKMKSKFSDHLRRFYNT